MLDLVLSRLDRTDDVEVVERKGVGHPDTICDALAETLSRNLCREYQTRFGRILHHNVDKALLCGGRSTPAFGGGSVMEPIRIFLAGRAVSTVDGAVIPIKDVAVEGSRAWLKANLHALDSRRHVQIETLVQQGSQDLQSLFSRRGEQNIPLANDTSFGAGHAPLSALERLVLTIEQRLHARDRVHDRPSWGEDIKINILAKRLAETLVAVVPGVAEAHCLIVSRIGMPISMPALVHVKLATQHDLPLDGLKSRVDEIVSDHLGRIRELVDELVHGAVSVF